MDDAWEADTSEAANADIFFIEKPLSSCGFVVAGGEVVMLLMSGADTPLITEVLTSAVTMEVVWLFTAVVRCKGEDVPEFVYVVFAAESLVFAVVISDNDVVTVAVRAVTLLVVTAG
jgi:hypothetical protein